MARSRSVRCAPAWRRIPRESIAAWDTSQRPGRCFHSREFGTLAAGASCNITVWFSPIATGARTGTLTVSASVATVPASVALSGTGTSPGNLTLSPSSLTFGNQAVGTNSATQTVVLANGTGAAVTINAINTLRWTLRARDKPRC
jgi:hypothetical protein